MYPYMYDTIILICDTGIYCTEKYCPPGSCILFRFLAGSQHTLAIGGNDVGRDAHRHEYVPFCKSLSSITVNSDNHHLYFDHLVDRDD